MFTAFNLLQSLYPFWDIAVVYGLPPVCITIIALAVCRTVATIYAARVNAASAAAVSFNNRMAAHSTARILNAAPPAASPTPPAMKLSTRKSHRSNGKLIPTTTDSP